jgi:hypothetical protein
MPERHQQTARDDQRPTSQDGRSRLNMKNKEIDDLRRHKEKSDIDPEQPAEIPTRRIDDDAVRRKQNPAQNNQADSLHHGLRMETGSDDGIPTGLEQSRNSEDDKGKKV